MLDVYFYYGQNALTLKISSLLTLEISHPPFDMRKSNTCVTADGIQRSTQVLGNINIQQGQSNPNDDYGHSSPKMNTSTTNLGINFFCLLIGLLLNEGHHVLNLKQEKHKSLLFFLSRKPQLSSAIVV